MTENFQNCINEKASVHSIKAFADRVMEAATSSPVQGYYVPQLRKMHCKDYMKKQIDPLHLVNSAALEFADFKPFNFRKQHYHWQSKLRDFLIHEVIDRVEKTYFEVKCSTGAMAFVEKMGEYTFIKHGVGSLLLASCEIIFNVDFDLAGTTIMYHVVDPKSEQTLATHVIAE